MLKAPMSDLQDITHPTTYLLFIQKQKESQHQFAHNYV